MLGVDDVLAWIAIGASASLAGMIWAFRRGTIGVVANLVAGAVGAVAFGLGSRLLLPVARRTPLPLFFAALGAIVALLVVHGLWNQRVRDRRRSVDASRPAA